MNPDLWNERFADRLFRPAIVMLQHHPIEEVVGRRWLDHPADCERCRPQRGYEADPDVHHSFD